MRGIIFDLDGTLIDSMYLWNTLAYEVLVDMGYNPDKNIHKELKEKDMKESIMYIKEKFNIEDVNEIAKTTYNKMKYFYEFEFELKPNVKEFLDILREDNVKICIGTTTPEEFAIPLLKRLEIEDYFEFIQTEDNVKIKKNDSRFFLKALERLGTDKECTWIFEDSLYAIKTSKEADFKVVGIGDKHSKDELTEIEEMSDIYIEKFSELGVDELWRNC